MSELDFEVFDPKMFMDSDSSPEDAYDHCDFGFAFNDSNFADRVLRIYIFSEAIESTQSPSARVKTLHISSPILAGKSPFFYKLFSNGMKESEQCHATLQINATEEDGLMELLKFMYSNKLTVTTAPAVFDVLLLADKYDVASCTRYCGHLLRTLPMTPESVLVYLDLPSTIIMSEAFQPLTVAVKQFYVVHFKDMTKFQDDMLSMPLAGVEELIASDDLRVLSENTVFRFVIEWAMSQYPKLEDCRKILARRLTKFIRYPYMTRRNLTDLLTREEFDPEFAQKVVTEALSFKSEVPHKKRLDENSNLNRMFVERVYTYKPVKMVEFQQPRPHCVVYLELKRDMCASLGFFLSEAVDFRGQWFYLGGQYHKDKFGLFLGMVKEEGTVEEAGTLALDYEFAIRYSMHAQESVFRSKRSYTSTDGKMVKPLLLFTIPWTSFMGENRVYFIDDIFHVSVELSDRR